MINPDRLTVKAAEALNEAVSSRVVRQSLVYDLHLLGALLEQDEGIVVPILQKLGASVPRSASRWSARSGGSQAERGAAIAFARAEQVFDRAEDEAKSLGDEYISTEHLLLALADARAPKARSC